MTEVSDSDTSADRIFCHFDEHVNDLYDYIHCIYCMYYDLYCNILGFTTS